MEAVHFHAPRTLAEGVGAALRERILSGALSPGALLSQDRLAGEYGVSRVPIRDALRELSAEGLVKIESHKRAYVTMLSGEELRELLTLTGTLESLAVVPGVERMTDADLHQMESAWHQMAALTGDPLAWMELNLRFHLVVTRAAGWPRLQKLVEDFRKNASRYFHSTRLFSSEVDEWHRQHRAIYEACRSRDADAARTAMEEHWRYSTERVLEDLGDGTSSSQVRAGGQAEPSSPPRTLKGRE